MKKLIALLVAVGFIASVAGLAADAAVAKKATPAKKVVKKPVKKAAPKKAAPAPAPVAPVAPPPPVAPVMPKAPVVAKAATPSLFGLGWNTNLAGTYINTGKGQLGGTIGAVGSLVLDDPLALGTIVGLSASAVKYRVGLGYFAGGGGIKAVPLVVDGVLSLPAEMMGGLDTYVGGGLNYTLTGNGSKSGKYGIEVYVGLAGDLGLGLGKTALELGYTAVRSNTRSSKGISISVCQPLTL